MYISISPSVKLNMKNSLKENNKEYQNTSILMRVITGSMCNKNNKHDEI